MNDILNQIVSQLNTMNQTLVSLDKRMESMETSMESMDNRMDSLEKRMESMEKRMDSLEKRMGSMESRQTEMYQVLRAVEENGQVNSVEIKGINERLDRIEGWQKRIEVKINDHGEVLDVLASMSVRHEAKLRKI